MRITAIVPSIPPRRAWLARALTSIAQQTRPADEILVRIANDRMWLGDQRDAMLAQATGDAIATLDDDDEWYPNHLAELEQAMEETNADMVFPWFDVEGGTDPYPSYFAKPWDNRTPFRHTTSVCLVKTKAARAIGGWSAGWDESFTELGCPDPGKAECGYRAAEDQFFVARLVLGGYHVHHHPNRTWRWHHHGIVSPHTNGLPSRW